MQGECPECAGVVNFSQQPVEREIVECEECGSQLIVTEVNPQLRLESAGDVGEDWGE